MCVCVCYKQKTAYEMRISDWSSDVCSSDLTGLLRMSEPGGASLHPNDPDNGRWYSSDVAAIAAAQGLAGTKVAPYFIDADATPNPGGWPIGGLTVVRFHTTHLVYAVNWYVLSLMHACATFLDGRQEWRLR